MPSKLNKNMNKDKNKDIPLEELAKLLAKNKITEFEFQEGKKKTRIKYGYKTLQKIPQPEKAGKPKAEEAAPKKPPEEIYILTAQLVGVFKPRVKLGEKVGLETILGEIVAMKIQNEINLSQYEDFKADYGIIEKIADYGIAEKVEAEDGLPVEYGTPLFQIKRGFEPEVIFEAKEETKEEASEETR